MFSLGTKVQDVLLGHPTSSCKLLVEDHLEFPRGGGLIGSSWLNDVLSAVS